MLHTKILMILLRLYSFINMLDKWESVSYCSMSSWDLDYSFHYVMNGLFWLEFVEKKDRLLRGMSVKCFGVG